ncbi:MAG: hypothetical protein ACJ78U_01360 [Myxococcales bacterium]
MVALQRALSLETIGASMRMLVISLLLLGGCKASPPVKSLSDLPEDTTQVCHSVCERISVKLSAAVVVAGAVGCVCEVAPGGGKSAGGAAASAGALIIAASAAANQQAQQSAAAASRQ